MRPLLVALLGLLLLLQYRLWLGEGGIRERQGLETQALAGEESNQIATDKSIAAALQNSFDEFYDQDVTIVNAPAGETAQRALQSPRVSFCRGSVVQEETALERRPLQVSQIDAARPHVL